MNKIAPYLFAPTGLWVFWLVVYIDHIVASSHNAWWSFPFFMTLFITEIIALAVTAISIAVINRRWKNAEE